MPDRPWRIDESVVLATLSDPMAVLGPTGDILETNPAWLAAFGGADLESGRDWFASDGEPLAFDRGPFTVAPASGLDISGEVMGCRGKDDAGISWFRVSRSALHDHDGELSGFVVWLASAADFVRHLNTARVLAEAGREFRQMVEPDAIASRIAAFAVRLTDPPARSSVIYIDENYEVARVHADHDKSLQGVTFALSDHPWIETTVRTGLPLRAELDIDLLGPTVRPYNNGIGRTFAGYAPIIVEGKVVAVVTVGRRTGAGIDPVELESLSALCEMSSIAMSRARSVQAVVLQGLTDPLTGLANRRGFDRRVAELPRVPYAVMAIAIDDLKEVNDRHGHHAGDELIRLVSETIALQLRRGDIVARTGGDQFLALFVNAYHTEITRLAERVVSALTQVSFEGRSPRVSIGCAGGAPQALADTVIDAAGAALERAKQRGKVSIEVEVEEVVPVRPPG
jgi:diguanylate cyclase (GGDEF)-like protein